MEKLERRKLRNEAKLNGPGEDGPEGGDPDRAPGDDPDREPGEAGDEGGKTDGKADDKESPGDEAVQDKQPDP